MNIKRYLLLIDSTNDFPGIMELPATTLEEAWTTLKLQFERAVRLIDPDHKIEYKDDGKTASFLSTWMEYSLCYEGDNGPCFFVWNGEGEVCKCIIQEVSIPLLDDELENAFRLREYNYRLEDAKIQFFNWVGYDPNAEEDSEEADLNRDNREWFQDIYGHDIIDVVTAGSDFYQLDSLVSLFNELFDANIDENAIWENVMSIHFASLRTN